jgi:hypothetical protein
VYPIFVLNKVGSSPRLGYLRFARSAMAHANGIKAMQSNDMAATNANNLIGVSEPIVTHCAPNIKVGI